MGRIVFGAWIPRSYLHAREVRNKIENSDLRVSNVRFGDGVSFQFSLGKSKVLFRLDGNGLYTLSSADGTVSGKELYEILLEHIIKTCHSVTYKQIKDGSLPLSWCLVRVGDKQTVFGEVRAKSKGETYYLKNCSERVVNNFLQLILFNQFLYSMMDKMEELYHSADGVASMLEKAIELDELRKIVLEMDLIVKDVVESHARLRQARIIFDRFCSSIISKGLTKSDRNVFVKAGFTEFREQSSADFDYITELWQLLIDFLEKIDSAAEARFSYQESLESTRIESLLSIEAASSLAPIVFSIFLTETYGIGGLILSFGVFLVWLLIVFGIKRIRTNSIRIRTRKFLVK